MSYSPVQQSEERMQENFVSKYATGPSPYECAGIFNKLLFNWTELHHNVNLQVLNFE